MRITDTKERLIEAALDLFSVKGYEGTTVEEIAGAVGIKAPSIYDHFKGKEAILQAMIERADEEYNKGIEMGKAKAFNISSGEELIIYAMQSIRYTINNDKARKMRRMFTIEQFRNGEFANRATRHNISIFKSVYSKIFAKLMDEGVMIKGDPDIFALEFVAPVTLMIQLCDREEDKKEEAMRTIKEHMDSFVARHFV
ncbi:MAG: TetR/AcrR family transcriptional regulator [Lachnospiraceae bacterium]|nr:TetR/AcrR family transcriptional regulator [Lachnospiraceae bacterium]